MVQGIGFLQGDVAQFVGEFAGITKDVVLGGLAPAVTGPLGAQLFACADKALFAEVAVGVGEGGEAAQQVRWTSAKRAIVMHKIDL